MSGLFNIDLSQGEESLIDIDAMNAEAASGDEGATTTTTTTETDTDTGGEGSGETTTVVNNQENDNTFEVEDNRGDSTIQSEQNTTGDETDTSGGGEAAEQTSSLSLTNYAAVLTEEGILPNFNMEEFNKIENTEDQAKALMKAHEDRINEGISSWVEKLPDRLKTIIENYQEGATLETLIQADTEQMNYGDVTEDQVVADEALQERILREDLSGRGYSAEEANDLIQALKDSDKLETNAKRSLTSIKQKASQRIEQEKLKAQQEQAQAEQQYQAEMQKLNKMVTDTTEIIPGMQINKTAKTKLVDSMTKAVAYDDQGNPISALIQKRNQDPMAFEMKLHYLFNLTNGFEDFSKITNAAQTTVTKSLSERLQQEQRKAGKSVRVEAEQNKSNAILSSIRKNMQ